MLFVSVLFCLLVFKVGLQVQLEEVVVRGGSELLWQLVPDCCVQCCEVFYGVCGLCGAAGVGGCSGVVGGSVWCCGRGCRRRVCRCGRVQGGSSRLMGG